MNPPRNLSTTIEALNYAVNSNERSASFAVEQAEKEPDNPHQYQLIDVPRHLAATLACRHGRGDTVEEMRRYFYDTYVPMLSHAAQVSKRFFPDHRLRLHFESLASWQLLFALVCFDQDGSELADLEKWFTPDAEPLLYAMIAKAFVPARAYAKKYDHKSCAAPHEAELVAALLQPRETWPAACAAYMRVWPKLMKPYGYREHVAEDKHPFSLCPLHLGLAVCAFDIDDGAFRHLPYYPRDLVDYYREHIRHTRDAWRTRVIEPASELPESEWPRPPKIYALTKSQAYSRWVELACADDPALIALARKALGRRKTMPPLFNVMEALAGAGLAIQADIKDNETVAHQVLQLCQTRNWPAPAIPDDAPEGPAGVTFLLLSLQSHLQQLGQHLAVLSDGGDTWYALTCNAEQQAEFEELCEQLELELLDQADWQ